MKKSKRSVVPISANESLEQMSAALVCEGYILPTRVEDFSDDELSLFGQGTPKSYASLKRDADALTAPQNENISNDTVYESMAMAARNGQQISDDVWTRMQADRLQAESASKSDD